MMDYTEFVQMALDMLREYGAAVSMQRKTAGVYNPAAPTPPATVTTWGGVAARFGYIADVVDGTRIKSGDQKFYLGVLDDAQQLIPEPRSGDTLKFAGKTYTVVACEVIGPAGDPVLYIAQARGG